MAKTAVPLTDAQQEWISSYERLTGYAPGRVSDYLDGECDFDEVMRAALDWWRRHTEHVYYELERAAQWSWDDPVQTARTECASGQEPLGGLDGGDA